MLMLRRAAFPFSISCWNLLGIYWNKNLDPSGVKLELILEAAFSENMSSLSHRKENMSSQPAR
jgi:hypothetical protein